MDHSHHPVDFIRLLDVLFGMDNLRDEVPHCHSCPHCGTTWQHTRNQALAHGYTTEHTCKTCGTEVYERLG